ncbi:MAG: GtrA family protein [Spirochaetales bacterium]|nr:GtrA family protein [Spirochaetales bacterium]
MDLLAEIKKMIKYGLVGLLNTGIFSLCAFLAKKIGLNYILYTLVGYIIAINFSFFMNRKYTFRSSKNNMKKMFLKFLGVTLSLLLCVQVIQYLLIDILQMKELYGVIFGMVFYTGTGFLINRFFVFNEEAHREAA